MEHTVPVYKKTQDGLTSYTTKPKSNAELTKKLELLEVFKAYPNYEETKRQIEAEYSQEGQVVEGLDGLADIAKFVNTYKSRVAQSDEARKVLALELLKKGVPAEEVKKAANTQWHTLLSWVSPTGKDVDGIRKETITLIKENAAAKSKK